MMEYENNTPEDETRAMRQKTKLTEPSPLLLRVRLLFTEAGGSGDAFDFAVSDYAAKCSTSNTQTRSPA